MGRRIAVVGLGTMGAEVARYLSRHGAEVLGVDPDEGRTRLVSSEVSRVAIADGTDREALRRLGIAEMHGAIVCIRSSVEASVMATLVLARHLRVPEVISRAVSENHSDILYAVGASTVVYPEREMGRRVASAMLWPQFRDYFAVSGDLAIVEYAATDEMTGQTLGQLDFKNRFGAYCMAIRRGGTAHSIGGDKTEERSADRVVNLPDAATKLGPGDVLVLLGFKRTLEKL